MTPGMLLVPFLYTCFLVLLMMYGIFNKVSLMRHRDDVRSTQQSTLFVCNASCRAVDGYTVSFRTGRGLLDERKVNFRVGRGLRHG